MPPLLFAFIIFAIAALFLVVLLRGWLSLLFPENHSPPKDDLRHEWMPSEPVEGERVEGDSEGDRRYYIS